MHSKSIGFLPCSSLKEPSSGCITQATAAVPALISPFIISAVSTPNDCDKTFLLASIEMKMVMPYKNPLAARKIQEAEQDPDGMLWTCGL
mmetsp:Transcript_27629/g.70395  ORF Transcript_27629/g.70395 Transcript_27629/m.70395 type:complete len:90 (+) Transcript_27629:1202-1471(+)